MNKTINKPGKRLLALGLAMVLALGTLPQTVFAVNESEGGTITAFEPLEDSVKNQEVPLGTTFENLNLPDTLTATVEIAAAEQADSVQDSGTPAQENTADTHTPGEDSVSGNNVPDTAGDKENPDAAEQHTGTPSEAQQDDDGDSLQIQATGSALALGNSGAGKIGYVSSSIMDLTEDNDDTDSTQQAASVPVLEWTSEPEYDSEALGTYVFTPVLDEAWSLAEDVELPTITVQVIMGIMLLSGGPSTGTMTIGGTSGYDLAVDHAGTGWDWEASTSTLTLDSTYTSQEIILQCAGGDTIYVEYSGDVTINEMLESLGSMDIRCTGADTDKLTVTNDAAAIASRGDLFIHSGTILARSNAGNAGLFVRGSLSILGSASVEAYGGGVGTIYCQGTVTIDTTGSILLLNPGGFYIKGTATVHYVNGTVETGGTTAIAPSISGTSHITMGMDETVTRTVDLGAGYFEATGYTVASEDPSIATAVQNDNTITITGVAMGTTSVTVTWVGGALAGQTTSIGVEVTPRWGIDGIFNLSVLPSSNISGTDTNTPWSWDSTAQTLTLTGSGPYTIEGTANETARIVAVLNGNMEIEINGDLKAPPLTSGYDGHPALTASGNGDLILTGSGSLVGGTHPYWAGHGVRASELTGDVFISGSLQITGGYGNYCGGIGVRLSGNDLTLSGTVTLTGGNSGAGGVGSHGVYHDTSPYGNIFVSGQIAVTGGDGGYGQQNGVAIGGTGVGTSLIHFTDPDASLTVKNGQAVTTATARDFVNDTPNTRWDIDTSAIAGGGTVYDQNITVNIPASPGSLTVGLSLVSPSITTEPVNQAINEGQTASFSVESTGAQLTYQWQVNKQDGFGFQNVADGNGGNTAQYTTPITDVGMHGYVYWVIVSNPAGSVTSNIAELTVNALVNAEIPSITGQPESNVAYNQGSAATALSVTASVTDGGMLSYQWYENTINSNTGGTAVGTDSSTYTPSTATAGTLYYYCEVTNTNTGVSGVQTATNTSSVAAVVVNTLVNAEMPGITVHPQSATYNQGNTATPLSVTANVSDDGTLSYQWYENTINSNTGGTAVGTDSSTYTPGTATAGTLYYYCEVTNTNPGVNGVQTAALNSNTAAITVNHFSGGNSSSSSDDSSDSSIHSIVIGKQPDYPTVISVTGSTAGTAQKTFTITDSMVKTALDKALAEAKKLSRSPYGIGAQVALDAPATAITVTMERAGLNRLVSEKAKLFEVTGIPVGITLDANALLEIQSKGDGDVIFTIKPATASGVRNAYDITISTTKDGKSVTITSLGTGTATLAIPYAPGKDEAAGYLYAVTVDDSGKSARIASSAYDAGNGCVIFSTNHFSVYGIGYTAPSAKFTDIADHWAKESIDYVVGRGLLSGTSDSTFSPDTAMTRGMLVTVLGRLSGTDMSGFTTSSFNDVNTDSYYAPYIEWAYKKGIVQGEGNGQFAPDRAVTREEIAMIFSNYAKAIGYTLPVNRTAATYADASTIGSAYKTAVTAMQQAGIMMGDTNNKFNPKSSATRAEVSAMLTRYVKLTIAPDTAQGWAVNDAGQWLYYKDGKALTGEQTIDGVKYFFYTTGVLKTGWVQDGSNWRFYSGNKLLTGWWDIGSGDSKQTYFFDTYGNMTSGKWLQIEGKWYYFNADGSLARNTTIDGYEVDENGVRKTE